MTSKNAKEMVEAIRKAEYDEFVELVNSIITKPKGEISWPKDQNAPWCSIMIFHMDDMVHEGQVVEVRKQQGGDWCRYDINDTVYTLRWIDGNGNIHRESADQCCAGELSKVTDRIRLWLKEQEDVNLVTEIMYSNYKNLSYIEKLFLNETVGDEKWIANHKQYLIPLFNGKAAPSGDQWECACYPETQMAIRNRIAKGTKWA